MNITLRSSSRAAIGIAALALFAAAPLLGQPTRGSGQNFPRYDLTTETTVTGTVESVDQAAGPGGRGRQTMGGTHLVLKTGTETLEVHLAPAAFLSEQKVDIVKGDALVILGSRVTVNDRAVLIAKEVRKGASVWTLRNSAGQPLWRRGGVDE